MPTPMSLNDLMKKNGLTEKDLQQAMEEKHCHEIAIQIGKDWQALAAFIGISDVDVDDIKEAYQEPQDRRLALLRKWKKLHGQKATYAKMAHGLEQIGNRQLIESLISVLKTSMHSQKESQHSTITTGKRNLEYNRGYKTRVVFISVLVSLLCSILTNIISINEFICVPHTQPNSSTIAQMSNCSHPVEHDLPRLYSLFVGRENDIREVVSKVMGANIVNINGAPAFGKSTLAIHVGYRLIENCISVRYINMEELSSKILSEFDYESKRKFEAKSKEYDRPKKQTATVTTFASNSSTTVKVNVDSIESQSSTTESSFIEELKQWSKVINDMTTVLIFDNADVLRDMYRIHLNFIHLIDLLVQNSNLHLHIIVVSQERLILLENFDQWSVKELNQQASVELLSKLAPDITNGQLHKLAELVQGCPLALKVIGTILHIGGQDITYELESELQKQPIDVLDKVSYHRQRFSVMMDLVLSKLDFLQECGYTVSLFPGSFSREAGIEILSSKKCLEMFEKHSLLDDYFLGNQHRYKMHWLISEYLKKKVNSSDKALFKQQFHIYYTQFLLNYAKSELSDLDKHVLSSESKNIHFFYDNMLMMRLPKRNYPEFTSPEVFATLMFLVGTGCLGEEIFDNYFNIEHFIHLYEHASELLHPVTYAKFIWHNMKHFIKQCWCNTIQQVHHELQQIFDKMLGDRCEYFDFIYHCKLVAQLFSMHSLLRLPQHEEEFLYNIGVYNCPYVLSFKEIVLSFQYYKKYLVLVPVIFLISLAYTIVLIGENNRSVLLHAYSKLHFKYKCLVIFIVTVLALIAISVYKGSQDEDKLVIVEVGIKLLCYTFSILPLVFICMYMLFVLYRSPSYMTCMLDICIGSILLVVAVILNYFIFDKCFYLPICH